MKNKYLTKIASNIVSNIVKPVYGAAKDIVKGVAHEVGSSAHKALGGGFRDAAVAKGITNQKALRDIHDPRSYLKATRPKGGISETSTKGTRKAEIKNLQSERNKSIVKTIGYGTAGAIGASKLKDKVTGQSEPQYY
jgi:hypothetical protein